MTEAELAAGPARPSAQPRLFQEDEILMSTYEVGKVYVNDEIEMVRIVAQFVREGVTFEVDKQKHDTWVIVLTGGY